MKKNMFDFKAVKLKDLCESPVILMKYGKKLGLVFQSEKFARNSFRIFITLM